MAKEPIVCTVCESDRFIAARKIFRVALADGGVDRNWGSSPSDAQVLQCVRCWTNYVWNARTKVYDRQRPWVPSIPSIPVPSPTPPAPVRPPTPEPLTPNT